ncbi:MarR family winged helix-turn-helix transcriptional regulator [Christensenella hongkongensis]|nr:MarR family transcriptional regulator [Christensenella hongkongensis]
MERVIHKYNQWESKKRTYGTSVPLSRAEIHTIAAVGDHPNINITTLAAVLGITKGAASQMIYKLVDKGAVEKRVSPDSDSEVVLNLTEQGQINYEMHREYHRQTNDEILIMLRDIPQPLYDQLTELLSVFERSIDKRLNE